MANEPMPADGERTAQALFESERWAAQLSRERQALADRLDTVEAAVRAEAEAQVSAVREERDRAVADAIAAREAAERARDAAWDAQARAEAALAHVTGSTAWRITAPVRLLLIRVLGRPR